MAHPAPSGRCLFCGYTDQSVTIYQDEMVQAFISLQPINGWHVLVVPRAHYERLSELPLPTLIAVTIAAQHVSKALEAAARPDGITTITEDDFAGVGYNLVPHWKLHLIARFKGDAVKLEWGRSAEPGPSTRAETAQSLRRHLQWIAR
ncbi:MAG: histidine triad protein [Gemmatimonadetes bacterium]|nr:histidine triad protein [Gemmatimonadota bacterium]